jgi:hypothetical protein
MKTLSRFSVHREGRPQMYIEDVFIIDPDIQRRMMADLTDRGEKHPINEYRHIGRGSFGRSSKTPSAGPDQMDVGL